MSAREVQEWAAFARVHRPLPDPHWDAAHICKTIAGALGGGDNTVDDFLPRVVAREPEAQSGDEAYFRFKMAMGARGTT